jgi:8-oxo-dGTP diphosphatase
MEVNTGRIQAKQPTMYTYEYPMPAVTVDIVVFSIREEHLQVLFVKRGAEPFKGKWALPGGFVNLQESLEDAAQRELQEETGVAHAYLNNCIPTETLSETRAGE